MVKSSIAKKFVINESNIKSVPDYVLKYLELQNSTQAINMLKSSVESWMKQKEVNQIVVKSSHPEIMEKYGTDSFVNCYESIPQLRNSFNEEICGFVFQQWLIKQGYPNDLGKALEEYISMIKQENKRRFDLAHKDVSAKSRMTYGKSSSRSVSRLMLSLAKWDDDK
jgi:hypothetical protein